MLSSLRWLALEVKHLDPAVAFYRTHFDLPVRARTDREVRLGAGGTDLVLRRPAGVPRGGLHTHYAFATPAAAYDGWVDRLGASLDLEQHQFGPISSLYCYDVVGNCVEVMGSDDGPADAGITGLVEVVLEVEDLPAAETLYTDLGLSLTDRGANRRRVRLTAGPFDLELWEPQLGLADGRGGVHVDLGFETPDPAAARETVGGRATRVESVEDGIRVRDPDGHYLTFVAAGTD